MSDKAVVRKARAALKAMDAQEREVQQLIEAIEAEEHLPCDPAPVVNGLDLRHRLGRRQWGIPVSYGCCGWSVDGTPGGQRARVLVTADHASESAAGVNWVHASISRRLTMPTYGDLTLLHHAAFGEEGWAYQVFAPTREHINIHERALHLFGRADGERVLPDFGRHGTI